MNHHFEKQLFIVSDLYGCENGVLALRNQVDISLLKKEYGKIYDGMKIWLSADTKNNGKKDPTIFPGIIKDLGKDDEYEILVREKDMQYLSQSDQFKDYSIEDIVGYKKFKEEERKLFPNVYKNSK